jgi:hypothetical protein
MDPRVPQKRSSRLPPRAGLAAFLIYSNLSARGHPESRSKNHESNQLDTEIIGLFKGCPAFEACPPMVITSGWSPAATCGTLKST